MTRQWHHDSHPVQRQSVLLPSVLAILETAVGSVPVRLKWVAGVQCVGTTYKPSAHKLTVLL